MNNNKKDDLRFKKPERNYVEFLDNYPDTKEKMDKLRIARATFRGSLLDMVQSKLENGSMCIEEALEYINVSKRVMFISVDITSHKNFDKDLVSSVLDELYAEIKRGYHGGYSNPNYVRDDKRTEWLDKIELEFFDQRHKNN